MSYSFLKAYWKPLVILALLAAMAVGCWVAWVNHGTARYDAGYAQAQADQRIADDKTKQEREREKVQNEREAQERIDKARNDARIAAERAGRLQQQIAAIRKQLTEYSASIGAGPSTGDTGVLLADVLSQSLERNLQLAEYADRAAEAGRTCERQYDSLKGEN
ncbi:DUF2514 domain-containing protein [Buttiauxella sp. B2]|uniref:DUF2514 domain-containing protein n=1 Tax=Buttiauxella sp. B2 TaxID=2587812 RepID=UPI001120B9EB|nr:DUF2514 domain-containing protein [Buttiauxella sp. B2]TNV22134.1 DUF2514 domain-containing protein [Buttiauxella sp. B2]